jgi:diguanylate cyclase (GGDEF)-like protein
MADSPVTNAAPTGHLLGAQLLALIVEPSSETAASITCELHQTGYTVSAERVERAAHVGAALDQNRFDIIICTLDYAPVLQALRERQLETPVIVVSERNDDVTALEAIADGAENVLKRDELYRLPFVVGLILQHAQIRQDQSAMLATNAVRLSRTRHRFTLPISLCATVALLLLALLAPGGVFLKIAVITCFGVGALGFVVMPIERLRRAAAELSMGSLDRDVAKGLGPYGDIATGLDTLRRRLKRSVLARRRDLAQRFRAEEALRQVHLRLRTQIDATQSRAHQFTLLAEMGALLQACATRDETQAIIDRFNAELFPGMRATVYLDMSATDCWALRRGQTHIAIADGKELRCAHVATTSPVSTLCIPLMAQGTAIGVLHLRHADLNAIPQALAEAVAEQISLCLANLALRERLRDLTITDPLTGLYNRRFVAELLAREIQRAERQQSPIGLIAIDIDHFKRINDSFGHDGGDAALRALAELFRSYVRGADIACRMGGEEFALVLPGASDETTARRAEELRRAVLDLRIAHAHHELPPLSISCGVAVFPDHARSADEFLKAGDLALYRAKESGRNCVMSAAA